MNKLTGGGYIFRAMRKLAYAIDPIAKWLRFKKTIINKVSLWQYIRFKLTPNKQIYWPVHRNSEVTHPNNIYVGINSNPGTRPGCYLQGNGGIWIGNYVHFASNIGIISANHCIYNQTQHDKRRVIIKDYCWIGMNSVILPGVTLGERTIVGAGSIVTKSFPDGYCVIAGNPANLIKCLNPEEFVPTKFPEEYYGYIPKEEFPKFSLKYKVPTNIFKSQ